MCPFQFKEGIMCPHISPWPFPKNKRQVKAVDENTFILSPTSAMPCIPAKCRVNNLSMPKGGDMESVREK